MTEQELLSPVEKRKRDLFDKIILAKLGDSLCLPPTPSTRPKPENTTPNSYDSRNSDEEKPQDMIDEDPLDESGTPIFENSFGDTLINAEVLLPQGGELQKARVRKRVIDTDGNEIGEYYSNPLLNTLVYEVEFPDGTI